MAAFLREMGTPDDALATYVAANDPAAFSAVMASGANEERTDAADVQGDRTDPLSVPNSDGGSGADLPTFDVPRTVRCSEDGGDMRRARPRGVNTTAIVASAAMVLPLACGDDGPEDVENPLDPAPAEDIEENLDEVEEEVRDP